jgi:RecA-family ATPase
MKVDINDTLRTEGTDAVRARHDRAKRYKPQANGAGHAEKRAADLITVTPSSWTGPAPEMKWLVRNRIPAGDVTLLLADGGSGKTEIAVQLAIAVALSLGDWLGACVEEAGLALIVSAEEPESNIRMRCERICRSRGLDMSAAGNLHSHYPDLEATWLVETNRNGALAPTPFFNALKRWVLERRPALVVIDAVVAVYGGMHIDRNQVRTFIAMLRKLARESGTTILLLDHPSVRGMQNGSGSGGSVDWNNGVRSRMYLHADKDDDDLLHLQFMKNNYGRKGEAVALRWDGHTFAPAGARTIETARIDELFLKLVHERNAQGRWVTPSKATGYAPRELAAMPGAEGATATAFAAAMERLLAGGRVTVETFGPPSKQRQRLVATFQPPSNRP